MLRNKSHNIEVFQDEYGDYFIEFPSEISEELNLKEGDVFEYDIENSNELILTKIENNEL